MELSIPSLIEETRNLWNTGRKVMVQVAWNLNQIKNSDAWKEHKSFPLWVEEELGISQSQTSKLLTIAEYYLQTYTPDEIGPVDYENLYKAARLPGTVEENLAKAKTLTRTELKQEKAEITPHEYKEVRYCKVCGLSPENHD